MIKYIKKQIALAQFRKKQVQIHKKPSSTSARNARAIILYIPHINKRHNNRICNIHRTKQSTRKMPYRSILLHRKQRISNRLTTPHRHLRIDTSHILQPQQTVRPNIHRQTAFPRNTQHRRLRSHHRQRRMDRQ